MANSEKVIGFRFDEDILEKLDYLMEDNLKESERMNVTPKSKKEFFEDGIRELYFKKINQSRDADVSGRINDLIDDKVNVSIKNLNRKIDELLFISKKMELGNKLLYRSPNIIPPPTNIKDCIEVIVDERSGWNDALDEYMLNAWRSNKIKNHLK